MKREECAEARYGAWQGFGKSYILSYTSARQDYELQPGDISHSVGLFDTSEKRMLHIYQVHLLPVSQAGPRTTARTFDTLRLTYDINLKLVMGTQG